MCFFFVCFLCHFLSYVCFPLFFFCVSDPCNPNPCVFGGACSVVSSNSYTCSCVDGRSGSNCQIPRSMSNVLTNATFNPRLDMFNNPCPSFRLRPPLFSLFFFKRVFLISSASSFSLVVLCSGISGVIHLLFYTFCIQFKYTTVRMK